MPADSELRFGRFRLDPVRRLLLIDGEPSKLGARAIDVLVALAQRRTRVVGKDELFDLVWPGLVVEENNLQQHVSALRKLLGAQAISTVPGRGYQFIVDVEDGDDARSPPPSAEAAPRPPQAVAARGRDNLPGQLPPLVGRGADLADVRARVLAATPVTLVGPGGIGKTRLALSAAQSLRDDFDGGAWFVDLALLDDPALVGAAVAHVLAIELAAGSPSVSTIAAALRGQRLLLLLDNCEHLLDGVADLVAAVGALPQVRVLATSREPLRVAGEQVLRLSPLALPLPGEDFAGEAPDARPGAVQLFVARAQAADRRFSLTAENAPLVGDICRRLDGLPLAIELAAARLPALGLAALRDRLDDRLRLLTTGPRTAPWRQQTLRAALDWSHDLLAAKEREVFRRLAVFAGGFSLWLVERVVGDVADDPWAALDALGQLVDKSLVIVEGVEPRYRLLETMRSYALELLALSGEESAVRQRHAQAVRDLLTEFDTAVARERRFDQLYLGLEPELDNIRAAFAWAVGPGGEPALALAIAAASDWWWNEADALAEGLQWCRQLTSVLDPSLDPALAARFRLAYGGVGRVAMVSPAEWVPQAQAALDGFRTLGGDRIGIYRALCLLGGPTGDLIAPESVAKLLDEAEAIEDPAWSPRLRLRRQNALEWRHDVEGRIDLERIAGMRHVELAREAGGLILVGALANLADTEFALGHIEAAIELSRQSITEAKRFGRPSALFNTYANLVPALLARGDLDATAEAIREGRAAFVRGLGGAYTMLVHVALLACRRGDLELAARVIGAADRACRDSGNVMHPPERRARERLLGELERDYAPEQLGRLLREGEGWSEDEAFERAGFGQWPR